jgi:AAA-like domain
LNPLQYVLWKTEDLWDQICRRILDAIRSTEPRQPLSDPGENSAADLRRLAQVTDQTGAPLPAADPRLDSGAVELESPFYVQRTEDDEVTRRVVIPGGTVLIKGPQQMGKTSLLARVMGSARRRDHRVVYVDLQLVDPSHLESLKALTTYLAHRIAKTLRTTVKPAEVWDDYLGATESLTEFVEQAVLEDGAPVTLCLDEVDRVFDYTYRSAFFAMVRAWHNRRATHTALKAFGVVLVHTLEPASFIDDLNQSPSMSEMSFGWETSTRRTSRGSTSGTGDPSALNRNWMRSRSSSVAIHTSCVRPSTHWPRSALTRCRISSPTPLMTADRLATIFGGICSTWAGTPGSRRPSRASCASSLSTTKETFSD